MDGIVIPTGEIIKEYLDVRGFSQKDVSARTKVSEKHLSNLLTGKARLTEDMALKLEKLMPDVPASYWLNYERKYREALARQKEAAGLEELDLETISKKFHFKEVFPHTSMSLVEQAIEMLKLLNVSRFDLYRAAVSGGVEFMQDGGDDEAIVVWIKLCEDEVEEQNKELDRIPYNSELLKKSLEKLKKVALNPNIDESIASARKLLNKCGVYLVDRPAISNAKVRGALTTYNEHPSIFISKRHKTHDHVWFTLVHELAHLILHYDSRQTVVYMEDLESEESKDREANLFARAFFVDGDAYNAFTDAKAFTCGGICEFAKSQSVDPGIIVGFLQHDGFLDYSQFSDLKTYC